MTVDSTTSATSTNPGQKGSSVPGSTLDMQTFLQLLTVQLATQNPLEPMTDRDFFAQMAQLGTVQGIDSLRQSMNVAQATQLMGKTVTAVQNFTDTGAGANTVVKGVVQKMTLDNGEYVLNLKLADGSLTNVKMGNIISVEETPVPTTTTTT